MFKTAFKNLVGEVFANKCPGCQQVCSSVCENCVTQLSQLTCSTSSPKFHSANLHSTNLHSTNLYSAPNQQVIVAFGYSTVVRKMILAIKYRNTRSSIALLGESLADRILEETSKTKQIISFITWAPTTAQRKLERGHDHAEILARFIARELKLPCRGVLRRFSDQPQTGRSREQRLEAPQFISRAINNQCVVVIDDVVTTGATLKGASQALYKAGANLVICAAVASTVLWQSSTESYELEKARKSRR